MLYACDGKWWDHYKPDFSGLRFTQDKKASESYGLNYVPSVDQPGLCLKAPYIHRGANSGYQAINLAVHLGAAKIVLLGFDMQAGDKPHWHGFHPSGLNNPNQINFDVWIRNFDTVPPSLVRAGVDLVNCSRETALTCFRRGKLKDELNV